MGNYDIIRLWSKTECLSFKHVHAPVNMSVHMHVHIVGWFICMKLIVSGWAHVWRVLVFLAAKPSCDNEHLSFLWISTVSSDLELSLFTHFFSILLSHPRLYSVSITLRGQCCPSVCKHWAVSETKKNNVYLSFSLFRPLSLPYSFITSW